jgi:hypothetical protein
LGARSGLVAGLSADGFPEALALRFGFALLLLRGALALAGFAALRGGVRFAFVRPVLDFDRAIRLPENHW